MNDVLFFPPYFCLALHSWWACYCNFMEGFHPSSNFCFRLHGSGVLLVIGNGIRFRILVCRKNERV